MTGDVMDGGVGGREADGSDCLDCLDVYQAATSPPRREGLILPQTFSNKQDSELQPPGSNLHRRAEPWNSKPTIRAQYPSPPRCTRIIASLHDPI